MVTRGELRQQTHGRVLASAERLFRERGFNATTIRDIATDAGVSVGSVMGVGDKAQLLVTMYDHAVERIHLQRAHDGVPVAAGSSTGTADRIFEVITPFLQIFGGDAELSREYGAVLMSGKYESALFHGLADDLVREIAVVLEESGTAPADVQVAARAVYFAYLGAIYALAGRGETGSVEWLSELHAVFTHISQPRGQ